MNMYRRATGQLYDSHLASFATIKDEDIIHQYELITPDNIRKRARLLLFARLVSKHVTVLLELVFSLQKLPGSWSSVVLEDLRFCKLHGIFETMDIDNDFTQWAEFANGMGRKFYKSINKLFSQKFVNICLPSSISSKPVGDTRCIPCGLSFASQQAFALHNFKIHGVKNVLRQYVGAEVHCTVCLKLFWTRERLINVYLRRSRISNAMLMLGAPTYSAKQADEFDAADKLKHIALQKQGQRRHKAVEPCVQLQGPLQPILCSRESNHHPLGLGHHYVA